MSHYSPYMVRNKKVFNKKSIRHAQNYEPELKKYKYIDDSVSMQPMTNTNKYNYTLSYEKKLPVKCKKIYGISSKCDCKYCCRCYGNNLFVNSKIQTLPTIKKINRATTVQSHKKVKKRNKYVPKQPNKEKEVYDTAYKPPCLCQGFLKSIDFGRNVPAEGLALNYKYTKSVGIDTNNSKRDKQDLLCGYKCINLPSSNINIKNKILCICRKYSQKLLNKPRTELQKITPENIILKDNYKKHRKLLCECKVGEKNEDTEIKNKQYPAKVCDNGICSKNNRPSHLLCKCIRKKHKPDVKKIVNCSDETCITQTKLDKIKLNNLCNKQREINSMIVKSSTGDNNQKEITKPKKDKMNSQHKRVRKFIDLNEVQNIKSIVSCYCSQITSHFKKHRDLNLGETQHESISGICKKRNRRRGLKIRNKSKGIEVKFKNPALTGDNASKEIKNEFRDPKFEIKLDTTSMCILNPQEVEKNIEKEKSRLRLQMEQENHKSNKKRKRKMSRKYIDTKQYFSQIKSKSENFSSQFRRRNSISDNADSSNYCQRMIYMPRVHTKEALKFSTLKKHKEKSIQDNYIETEKSCVCCICAAPKSQCKCSLKSEAYKCLSCLFKILGISDLPLTSNGDTSKQVKKIQVQRKLKTHVKNKPMKDKKEINKSKDQVAIQKQKTKEEKEQAKGKAKEKYEADKKAKEEFKLKKKDRKQSETLKRKKERSEVEKRKKEYAAIDKKLAKEIKRKQKLDFKARLKQYKLEEKEMERLRQTETTADTNCLADLIIGTIKLAGRLVVGIVTILYKIISDPKRSIAYAKIRYHDPKGTLFMFQKWYYEVWRRQKFKIMKTVKGSHTLTILWDTFQETALFEAFRPKGKTDKEQKFIEVQNRKRKRRIIKRQNQALYGCRHMLLTTLRKTPCLWVYHICPNHYPHCLSLLTFLRNFADMFIFLCAVCFWTPCIVSVELLRAMLCCFMCT